MNYFISQRKESGQVEGGMPFMHCHEYYELYFLLSGEKKYITPKSLCSFKENTLVATAPFVLHKFEGGSFDRILITLAPNILSPAQIRFLDMLSSNDIVSFSEKNMATLSKMLCKMMAVFNTPSPKSEMHFFLLLGQLFAYIYNHGKKTSRSIAMESAPNSTATTPTILKVIDYINNHFTEKISLDDLSKQFGISKTWLIKGFYQTTKMTVINYKIHMQINLAKNLLVTTNLSLDSIAEQTGFSSTNYFRIMFKRYMEIAPNKYRKHTHDVK